MTLYQCVNDFTMSYGLSVSLFLAGLVGGFTHCAGMCSPFVLAQCNDQADISRLKSTLLIPYHMGRMTTYVLMAVMVHSVINMAFLFSGAKVFIAVPLLMTAALLFFVSAFPGLARVFPWVEHIRISVPYKYIEGATQNLMKNLGGIQRYGLGVLLGFMPCGLVLSALMAAATANTVLEAALAMTVFTLGTVPALVLVAFGAQSLKHFAPRAMKKVSQTAMVISGLWLFALAGMMVF